MKTHSLYLIRHELGALMETSKPMIVLEMVAVAAIPLALAFVGLPRSIIPLFVVGWASLWLRGKSWKDIGLRQPTSWAAIVIAGAAIAAAGALLSEKLVSPLLLLLTGEVRPRVVELAPLPANPSYFAFLLLGIWLLAAVGEESVYRGYVFNRLVDLFGSGWVGWATGLILSSLMFSIGHGLTNRAVIIGGFLLGTMEGGLYVIGRRNLWLSIVFHGTWDTIFLTVSFMGLSLH